MDTRNTLSTTSSLVELARQRVETAPEGQAYTFLLDGETEEATLTYAQLDQRARAIGGLLQELGARGERVLLLYPPGLEYVAAFVGCLYAGAIAVPAYPPDPMRLGRTLPRLDLLIADARARFALTTEFIRSMADALAEQSTQLGKLRWLATDEAGEDAAAAWKDPGATPETIAFIQYTSGSTGSPRGVMLTHGNLLHNSAAIHQRFEHTANSRGVIWLPPYHDMGLIGGVLQPLCGGFPVVLMSPLDFLKRPMRWLEAISRHRATTSGGPNFAYDLCVRKTTPEQRAALDLSSWDVAFNGAEPVRAETLDRFVEAFAPAGFRREAFYPCYGLAEGTLIVSGGRKAAPPVVRDFQQKAIGRGEALAPTTDTRPDDVRTLIGCGVSIQDQQFLIVSPETDHPQPEGRLGEIWVRGPSIAQGYWERTEESERTFRARRADTGEGPFLRTGDLGFVSGDELFVAGRIKDLIIVRGRNHYPQDIELTAEACHPALRSGCSAAFSVELSGEERLVLVHEVDRNKPYDADALADAIRKSVSEHHDLQVHAVVLIAPGSIPKTSSGKLQRRTCRSMYLAGELEVVSQNRLSVPEPVTATEAPRLTRETLLSLPAEERPRALVVHLRQRVASTMGIPASTVDADRPLTTLGLDSIHSIELKSVLEEELGVNLPLPLLLDSAGIGQLATRVLEELNAPSPAQPPLKPTPRGPTAPLSYAQERLLFLERLAAGNGAYNIPTAVLLEGRLDVAVLGRSLSTITRRHEALRARYPFVEGKQVQYIDPVDSARTEDPFAAQGSIVDLSNLPEVEREVTAARLTAQEARQPFDLERGPPMRVRLLRLAEQRHILLLTMHHIVSDGWSMGVLVRELGALYTAFVEGRPAPLPELRVQYADYAAWQRQWLEGGLLESEAAYWRKRLAGLPPLLELPTDRPRPAAQSFEGARHHLSLSPELTTSLKGLGRAEGVTPFMTLLSAFLVTLHERTGRTDLVVGTDVANREQARTQELIGLFVNQLVLRLDLNDAPTFKQLLARVKKVALEAYAHQHLPFDKLVEAVRPPRDPRYNPLFQVMFVLENAPLPPLELPGLTLRILEADDGGSPFDLSVLLSESGGKFGGVLRYSTALFDAATIARLAEAFEAILAEVTARPDAPLESLRRVITEREQRHKLAQAEELKAARLEKFKNIRRKVEG